MGSPITQEDFTTKIHPGTNAAEAICIHWWNAKDAGDTFDGTVHLLAYSDAPVSAHFVAEAGRVSQIAGWQQIAWHCAEPDGSVDKNPVWVGIECNPRCSEDDVATVAALIADIWRSVGRKIPLVKHMDAVATQCPGPEWSWWVDSGELYKLATQVYEEKEITMITDEDARKIARAILDRPMKNYLGNEVTPQALLYWLDNNQGGQYKLLVEANERTKAIADAIASGGEIDREQIEKTVKEAVDKAMEGYELTLAPKQDKGEANE